MEDTRQERWIEKTVVNTALFVYFNTLNKEQGTNKL